jgi:transposase-like protein
MLPPYPQEHHMPQTYARPEPSLIPIARPHCPTCQGRMMLTRIEPGGNGPDLRTFECTKCEHVYNVLAEDPIKSVKAQ